MLPATTRRRARDAAARAADVAHAWDVFDSYVGALPGGADSLAGAKVLELGPGSSLGAAVLIAAHGATVSVADPYLRGWDEEYHPDFFAALRLSLETRLAPAGAAQVIDRVLCAGRFAGDVVTILPQPIELITCADSAFDVVLSCAVMEHVRDVPAACAQLARITRSGGAGVHVVDFRDHRDFTRPLEYLTLDRELFWCMFDARWGECGNRWRHSGMCRALDAEAFRTVFQPFQFASEAYLDDVQRRLHPDFRALDRDELATLVGRFVCVRGAAADGSFTSAPAFLPPAGATPTPLRLRGYERIVVYGAGSGAHAALDLLNRVGLAGRAVACCDNDTNKQGATLCGLTVRPFSELSPADYDLVIVASQPGRSAISAQLVQAGLEDVAAFSDLGFVAAFAHPSRRKAAA